ncbi:hypothetical protein OIU79_001282 [Salix purpurea]|uniref:Uncharacterized protein n=1 Tax=Salix purpurea TaxID=77065 RepID=A0A9Q0V3K6_SALPP|nr:hypothetical protein OIU79_001282 [Salix purpurea]
MLLASLNLIMLNYFFSHTVYILTGCVPKLITIIETGNDFMEKGPSDHVRD